MKGLEARAAALLAGNGFILIRYFDRYMEMTLAGEPIPHPWRLAATIIAALVGIGLAYSLFGIAKGKLARWAELVSATIFVMPIIAWLTILLGF